MFQEAILLVLAVVIFIQASFRVFDDLRTFDKKSLLSVILDLGWWAVALILLVFWTDARFPMLYPRRSLFFLAAVASSPWAFSKKPAVLKLAGFVFNAVAILFLVQTARYLISIRSRIEGIDFFYYVCTARDLAAGFTDVSLSRYSYFPGVYTFWKIPFELGFGTLPSLQWWYISLVIANAILIGAIIYRLFRNFPGSILAILLYISLCSRYEAFQGVTEPLATLFALLGLLVWCGQPLTGRRGILRSILFGSSLGLALFAKQQAGFLALGAITFFVTCFLQQNTKAVTLSRIFLIPASSIVIFLVCILSQGLGLLPVKMGMTALDWLGTEGSFWTTLMSNLSVSQPLSFLSMLTLPFWVALLFFRKFRGWLVEPWFQMLGFTSVAGYFAFTPFAVRGYGHYALIPGTGLIIATVIMVIQVLRWIPQRITDHSLSRFVLLLLAILPFVRMNVASSYFYIWPMDESVISPQRQPWRKQADISSDIEALRAFIKPGERILIFPQRRNEIHYLLETRTPSNLTGYGWGKRIHYTDPANFQKMDGFLEISPAVLSEDDLVVYNWYIADANTLKQEQKLKMQVQLHTMSLWRPEARISRNQISSK